MQYTNKIKELIKNSVYPSKFHSFMAGIDHTKWEDINICGYCGIRGHTHDLRYGNPCPHCGSELITTVGKWVVLEKKTFRKNIGYWELLFEHGDIVISVVNCEELIYDKQIDSFNHRMLSIDGSIAKAPKTQTYFYTSDFKKKGN